MNAFSSWVWSRISEMMSFEESKEVADLQICPIDLDGRN
jgi:hypothetical protein